MKLGPVTKLDKRKTKTSKNMTITSCQKIVTSVSFFQVMGNLQPSGNRIPHAWSVKLTFSLIVAFYLTKPENRTKKSPMQLSYYCFE